MKYRNGLPGTLWRRKADRFGYWKRLFHRMHPAWPPLAQQIMARNLDRRLHKAGVKPVRRR